MMPMSESMPERLVTTPQASHKEFAVQYTRREDRTGGERREKT